jgi:DNA primase
MSYRRRLERIKQDIPIVEVLRDYGYAVRVDSGQREQQFSCNLHGDGKDGKPSARVYPGSNSWYCFACDRTRDAVATVREREGIGFKEALQLLEHKFNLPPLPWEDEEPRQEGISLALQLDQSISPTKTFEDARREVVSLLDMLTIDRTLPLDDILPFWEGLDQLTHKVEHEEIPETKGIAACTQFWNRLLTLLHGEEQ